MTIDELHTSLARFALGESPTDSDAVALMVLMHTHQVILKAPLKDRPGVTRVCAITRSHCAEAVSEAWPDLSDAWRTASANWHARYATETPYEVIEDIPDVMLADVLGMRKKLLRHPAVADMVPEDE